LLARGADINQQDKSGETALMHAVSSGYADIVTLLLARGANINLKDNNDNTALMHATEQNNTQIISMLSPSQQRSIKAAPDHSNKQLIASTTDESHPEQQTTDYFSLGLFSSIATSVIGVLALLGMTAIAPIVAFIVAVVSGFASFAEFGNSLSKQNTHTTKIAKHRTTSSSTSLADKSYLHSVLDRFIRLIPAACVVWYLSPVFCPPLFLVAIGIMSSISLGISHYTKKLAMNKPDKQIITQNHC
jgi:hypothetical protein